MKRIATFARWRWLLAIALGVALAPQAARAAAITGTVKFGDAEISVVNAETNWVGGDLLLVYTNPVQRTGSFTLKGLAQAKILAIGGGGAGGIAAKKASSDNGAGGGGGAGGFVTGDYVLSAQPYSITVGAGGQNEASETAAQGASGGATLITTNGQTFVEAKGGGGGGGQSAGGAGASGGGGSVAYVSRKYVEGTGGASIDGQGHAGGTAPPMKASGYYGAGGGGAGAMAMPLSPAANRGGDGLTSSITGTERHYAGGGGGGCSNSKAGGYVETDGNAGGAGGGGAGGFAASSRPGAGVDGFGGGGGGGGTDLYNVGGNGGCGGVYVRISFALAGPIVPPPSEELTYDGEEHVFARNTPVYSIVAGDGTGKNAGTNTVTLQLTDTKIYRWEDGGDPTGNRVVTQIIHRAQCVIANLQLRGWKTGTPAEATPDPTCEVSPGLHAADEPTYAYCSVEGAEYTAEKPTAPGAYFVRAMVKDDPNGNYLGDEQFAKFSIYDDPENVFSDYVDIAVAGYTGTNPKELTNFPYKVTLAADAPRGFSYDRAGLRGDELCFVSEAGELLPYEARIWNVNGESTVYVRIPLIGSAAQTVRLYWKVAEGASAPVYDPSEVWIDWPDSSKYDKIVPPKHTYGDVVKDGKIVNYWASYPQMDKVEWDVSEEPGKLVSAGALAYGGVVSNVVNSLTGEKTEEFPPVAGGVYRVSFTSAEPDKYETPEYHIDLRVVERTPWDDLKGGAESLTLSGRVLLANDDAAEGHEVTDQGYWQVEEVTVSRKPVKFNPYWTHEGEHATATTLPNLKAGVNHRLCHTNEVDGAVRTNVIWRLEDVMIGNTAKDATTWNADQCYLPFSATSKMISSYANRAKAATRIEAGNLVMCNVTGAAIYSPCYTNGIGTIYLDVVNGWRNTFYGKGDEDFYRLVVEVAEETVDKLPPTDENAYGEDAAGNITELGRIRPAQWKPYAILPLKRDNGATAFTALEKTNEVALAVRTGRTDNNFYRLCVQVDCRKPSRFRICRTSHYPAGSRDVNALILVDNVIVSYPRNTAEVTTYGKYQGDLKGREIVGQGGATMTPFPSVDSGAILARARPQVWANASTNADPNAFIQFTRLHYRWHYLNQTFDDWKTVDLRPIAGLTAEEPLDVPADIGDVEYWYETFTQMPFYRYYDYSGRGAGLTGTDGADCYSEETAVVTNRIDLAKFGGGLPGNNENWFIRLRDGRSDLERFRVYVKRSADAEPEVLEMEISANNTWRAFVRTPEKLDGGLSVRFEAINRQQPGDTEYLENVTYYRLQDDVTSFEKPNVLAETATGDSWSTVKCDAVTGGLLFQVQEETKAVSVVHSDYQNFNSWSDANKKDGKGLFVGKAEYNEAGASGASAETRTFEDLFATWHLSCATNPAYWAEFFNVSKEEMAKGKTYEPFKPFTGVHKTPNGLQAGPGQWVTGNYRDTATGAALQMQGQGKGYLQFSNVADKPRGIGTVSFKARLGQAISFTDFCYYDGESKSSQTNYTFVTRAAYDLKSRTDFSGNASLSVVGFYQPGVGAYELRVEQENAALKSGTTEVTGPGSSQRLTLYRWRYNAEVGGMTATELGARTVANGSALTTSSEAGNYGALFIDVQSTAKTKGVTYVRAGITRNTAAAGNTGSAASSWVWYNDTDDDQRLKCGSYGVLSANCPGRFVSPMVYVNGHSSTSPAKTTDTGFKYNDSSTFTFPSTGQRTCHDELLVNGDWAVMPWRMQTYETAGARYGLLSDPVAQPLEIYVLKDGAADWELAATTNICDYGSAASASKPIVVNIWSKDDCSVKIVPGGDESRARTDIVVDDFEVSQWRGESFDDKEGTKYFADVSYGSPTNFVFTQGWIVSGLEGMTNCQLNARRSKADVATSVRSPLMDGRDGRGKGLGMFSFTYENAQPNVNLLLQIATNGVDITRLREWSKSVDETRWTTITNFSFAGLSADELKKGSRSVYLGLHDAVGVMRVVMDPKVVAAVEKETDESKFASIDITSAVCRDEPALDETSWWGWNLRTTDDPMLVNIADVSDIASENGMTLGLNNSVTADTRDADAAQYAKHYPFVQTPLFGEDVVGEVNFRARKYAAADPTARVTLYGANGITVPDDMWKKLAFWNVSNATFRTYSYKTAPGENYRAFRFVVTGVDEVVDPKMPDETPLKPACRVLLDEVYVLEAIRTRVGFSDVMAFRSYLDKKTPTPMAPFDVKAREEQPLCKEAWGVQARVFASQLAEEVDLSTAKVRLWWFDGKKPWGFENWRNAPGARKAWLTACEGAPDVFKSTYIGSPDAVMSPQEKPAVVQYMLEVQYRTTKGELVTNLLEKADWPTPSWYSPMDYNVRDGNESFSAFNIIDTVAPGWAWINEMNIYGEMDENYENSDKSLQFVEIAAPAKADLTDWVVRFLYANSGDNSVTTNDVATFGERDLPGLKKDLKGMDVDSGCVFHVVASPWAQANKGLNPADGRLDGTWSARTIQSVSDQEIQRGMPIAVQLMRPSGVIAHELVAIGTNRWAYMGGDYLPENQVAMLNADEQRSGGYGNFFYVGEDSKGIGTNGLWSTSLGAFRNNGLTAMDWNNTMGMTPGRINELQEIPGRPPEPQGESIVIYSSLDGNHLRQTFGEGTDTNVTIAVVFPKGSRTGTNITYRADRWYQVGSVKVNDAVVATPADGARDFVLEVGKNVSNDLWVVASESVDRRLEKDYGLGPDNPYRAAVMDWLGKGRTKRGAFADVNDGLVGLAEFHRWFDEKLITNLTLTAMYWLDIDPTWNDGDLWLKGYIDAPAPVPQEDGSVNVRTAVSMMITNTATDEAWAPYVLQGRDPDYDSWSFAAAGRAGKWTNETFKITGILVNGSGGDFSRENWVPLRWFVFAGSGVGDSVRSTSFDENFRSVIDIVDPHSVDSPGHIHGWDLYPECPVWHRFDLDNRLQPEEVEVMTPSNKLSE